VLGVLGQDRGGVPLVVDQYAVGALGADGAHEPLGVSVRRGQPRRAAPDRDVLGREYGVEVLGELSAAVADQVGERAGARPGRPGDRGFVASSTRRPGSR
jgi:hypothetical protein